MASSKVSITEPHPSVPKVGGAYITSGRGGAGNYKRYKVEDLTCGQTATGPASRLNLAKSFKRQPFVTAGRGGTGNMYKSNKDVEERMFQFDEEMVRRNDSKAPVYHIGRGGAANFMDERVESSIRMRQDSSTSSTSAESETSATSNARGAFAKLTRRFS